MASVFPGEYDDLIDPLAAQRLGSPSHSDLHKAVNDAVEAVQAKVGINGSADASTLDYIVNSHDSRLDSVETTNTTQTFDIAVHSLFLNRIQEIPAFQHIITLLSQDRRDVNVLVLGDSVTQGNTTANWLGKFFDSVGDLFPTYAVTMRKVDAVAPYDTWSSANTINTGTGSHSLQIFNTAISGSRCDTVLGEDRLLQLVRAQSIDLIIHAHGHNEGNIYLTTEFGGSLTLSGNTNNGAKQSLEQFITRIAAVIEEVRLYHPMAPVLVVATNPEQSTTADDQDNRTSALARMSSLMGYSFIDTGPDMYADSGWPGDLMADNLHPTTEGYEVMASTLLSYFKSTATTSTQGMRPSLFTEPTSTQLLGTPHLTQTVPGTIDADWTVTNCTLTKETTIYEGSKGHSARLDVASAAAANVYQSISGSTLAPYLGKWVTCGARMYVPTNGQTGSAQDYDVVGSLRLYAAAQYSIYAELPSTSWRPLNNWHWVICTAFVPAATTSIRIDIYASLDGTQPNGRIYVDRCVLVPGIFLKDIAI